MVNLLIQLLLGWLRRRYCGDACTLAVLEHPSLPPLLAMPQMQAVLGSPQAEALIKAYFDARTKQSAETPPVAKSEGLNHASPPTA